MDINKNNYEAFFLDYYEGNLAPQQVAELMLFLEEHPGLKKEFSAFENISLTTLETLPLNLNKEFVFEGKEKLKKTEIEINPSNYEYYIIATIENTIALPEKKKLQEFLEKNQEYNKEAELYKKTILYVDKTIVFENKNELKRIGEGNRTRSFYYYAAAASILLLIGLFLFNKENIEKKIPLANNAAKSIPKTVTNLTDTVGTEQQVPAKVEIRVRKKPTNQQRIIPAKNTSNPLLYASKSLEKEIEKVVQDSAVAIIDISAQHPILATNPDSSLQIIALTEQKKSPSETHAATNLPTEQAGNQQPTTNNQETSVSFTEFLTKKIKTVLLSDELSSEEKKEDQIKKFNLWDLAHIATKGVSKLTGKEIKLKNNASENAVAYEFTAGNFSFSKSKSR